MNQPAKDPALTPVVGRLMDAWPSLTWHGAQLKVYFVVRDPVRFVMSFSRHMGLAYHTSVQHFQRDPADPLCNWPAMAAFPRQKQLYLDSARDGLRYSDALFFRPRRGGASHE